MRVATYTRVSKPSRKESDEQARRRIQDTDNQARQLREFCTRNNWQLVYEYVDEQSRKRSDRPQVKQRFEDARLRRFDLLLSWSLDTFIREGVPETFSHLQTLTSYGIEWKSYTGQYLVTCGAFKDAVIGKVRPVAEHERATIIEPANGSFAKEPECEIQPPFREVIGHAE